MRRTIKNAAMAAFFIAQRRSKVGKDPFGNSRPAAGDHAISVGLPEKVEYSLVKGKNVKTKEKQNLRQTFPLWRERGNDYNSLSSLAASS